MKHSTNQLSNTTAQSYESMPSDLIVVYNKH